MPVVEVVALVSMIAVLPTWLARTVRLATVAILVVGFLIWTYFILHGQRLADDPEVIEFWSVICAFAPTVAIAYAVTTGDALRTYQTIRGTRPSDPDHREYLRVTMAFIGGSLGAFFGLLQAVVVSVALLSVVDGSSKGAPFVVIGLEVAAMVFVAIVPFLAHGWAPWGGAKDVQRTQDGAGA